MTDKKDFKFMQLAIQEAKKAEKIHEVPIGAIIIDSMNNIIAKDYNRTISNNDPTAHAEILTIRKAAQTINNYRLLNTILYVTLEPCIMCMGAIIHARIKKIVFGAFDLKWGAGGSLYNFTNDTRLNHNIEITSGICGDECKYIIQNFFKKKRIKTISSKTFS